MQHKYLDKTDEDENRGDYSDYGREGEGDDDSSNDDMEMSGGSNSVCGSEDKKDLKKVFKNLRKATKD